MEFRASVCVSASVSVASVNQVLENQSAASSSYWSIRVGILSSSGMTKTHCLTLSFHFYLVKTYKCFVAIRRVFRQIFFYDPETGRFVLLFYKTVLVTQHDSFNFSLLLTCRG